MKILYCIQHRANIIKCIIHKLKYHYNDEALFFVEDLQPSWKGTNLFTLYPYNENKFAYSKSSRSELIELITDYVNNYIVQYNITLTDFDEIYCIWDLGSIWALYLSMKSIKYSLIEQVPHSISAYNQSNFWSERISKFKERKVFDSLQAENKLFDFSNDIIKSIYFFDTTSKIPSDIEKYKVKIFDYRNSFEEIFTLYKNTVYDILGYKDTEYQSRTIFLTNSVGYTYNCLINNDSYGFYNKDSSDNQYISQMVSEFYLLIIDYYYRDCDFALKLHPISGNMYKYLVKNNYEFIDSNILFELIFNKFDKYICPLNSNSLTIVKQKEKIDILGKDFLKIFQHLHFIKFALTLANQLYKILPNVIQIENINFNQFKLFFEVCKNDCKNLKDFSIFDFSNISESVYTESVRLKPSLIILNQHGNDHDYCIINNLFNLHEDSIIIVNTPIKTNDLTNNEIFTIELKLIANNNKNILEYNCSLFFKNQKYYNKIIDFLLNFRTIYLNHSNLSLNVKFDTLTNFNYLRKMLPLDNKCTTYINNYLLFYGILNQIEHISCKDLNDNQIYQIDEYYNIEPYDYNLDVKFDIKGKSNIVILPKNSRLYTSFIELTNNNLLVILPSKYKFSVRIYSEPFNHSRLLIANDFSSSSLTRIFLSGSDIFIGRDCMFSTGVEIRAHDSHCIFDRNGNINSKPKDLFIGNHVWVGKNCTILKNCYIDNNSIIGCDSIIRGKFNKGEVIYGNPAKVIKSGINWSRKAYPFFESI